MSLFLQVEDEVFVPVAMALMKHKTEDAYTFILEQLYSACVNLVGSPPKTSIFLSDYERAIPASVEKVFGTGVARGCLFHSTNAIIHKVANLGLIKYYTQSKFGSKNVVWRWIRRLIALPLAPPRKLNNIEIS